MKRRLMYLCLLGAALGALALPAYASKDEVQFGSSIRVPRDASIHDAVCFFCDVDAEGTVEGDIVVFFGDVHVGSNANHDVVNFFGTVNADDNAHIGQSVVSMFGSIRLGEDASIGKDLVAMFGGGLSAADSASVGGDRVVEPAWLFWGPLLFIFLLIIFVTREVRTRRRRAFMHYPIPPRP
jgi:hypothetical protein